MVKIRLLIIMLVIFTLTLSQTAAALEGWKVVAEDGVRNQAEDIENDNRYLWSTSTYTIGATEYLFVGTTSDHDYGRKPLLRYGGYGGDPNIYRTSLSNPDRDDWEEVQLPKLMTMDNEIEYYRGFRSMKEFNNKLYVGVHVDPTVPIAFRGCRLWKYDGTSWNHVIDKGFGLPSTFCHSIRGMEVFNDCLYVCTSGTPGLGAARLFRNKTADPSSQDDWIDVLPPTSLNPWGGFGPQYTGFSCIKEFNNQLYIGTSGKADVLRSNKTYPYGDNDWNLVFNAFDRTGNWNTGAIMSIEEFNGYLYIGTMNFENGASIFRSSTGDNDSWQWVLRNGSITPTNDNSNCYIWSLEVYNGELYAGTLTIDAGVEGSKEYGAFKLWKTDTGDLGDWDETSFPGFNDKENLGVRNMIVYKNGLFAGTARTSRATVQHANNMYDKGCEIWEKIDDIGSNSPPNKPSTPSLLSSAHVNESVFVSCNATDPNGDDISYLFEWGDGTTDGWTLWVDGISDANHIYTEPNNYSINVTARDIYGYKSVKSDSLVVNVTYDTDINATPEYENEINMMMEFDPLVSSEYSVAPYSYYWSFGDEQGTSELQNPTYTYENYGSYEVTLTVTDDNGDTSTCTTTVDVQPVTADFDADPCCSQPNVAVSLDDTSMGYHTLQNWTWNFGDGNSTYDRNTSHQFASDGYYNITLTVVDNESNNNIYYYIIQVESVLPEILDVYSVPPNAVGYNSNVSIFTEVGDNLSGINTVSVNITFPDNYSGNFTMNNTYGDIFHYNFSNTSLIGEYNYTIWTKDKAGNSNSSTGHIFNVSECFGHSVPGMFVDHNMSSNISGSSFSVLKDCVANNISAYVTSVPMLPVKSKCMIFRKNDSALIGTTDEINHPFNDTSRWVTYNFSNPKPVLFNDTEYILTCWSNDTCSLSYDLFDLPGNNFTNGFYNLSSYGTVPNPANLSSVTTI